MITDIREPKLRFRGFSDEWEEKNIGSLAKKIGSGKSNTNSRSGKFKIYGSTGEIGIAETFDYVGKNILIARVGANAGSMYKVEGKYNVSDNTLILDINDEADQEFIYNFLTRFDLNRLVFGSGQPLITGGMLKKVKIYIPAKDEQVKIAEFLSSVDEKIEKLQQKKELLEKYKKGMMQKIFSQKIRFKDNNGKDFPAWQEKFGDEVFQSVAERNNDHKLPILAITQDKGAIPRDQINYDISVTDASIDSYKIVRKGDFIISLRSFQGGIEYSEYDGICSPAYIILRTSMPADKRFYKYFLKTKNYIQRLTRKLEGIRDGKMISYKYFSEVYLPYPLLEEQKKIAEFLTSLDDKIKLEESKLEQAKQFKRALLQQMFA